MSIGQGAILSHFLENMKVYEKASRETIAHLKLGNYFAYIYELISLFYILVSDFWRKHFKREMIS